MVSARIAVEMEIDKEDLNDLIIQLSNFSVGQYIKMSLLSEHNDGEDGEEDEKGKNEFLRKLEMMARMNEVVQELKTHLQRRRADSASSNGGGAAKPETVMDKLNVPITDDHIRDIAKALSSTPYTINGYRTVFELKTLKDMMESNLVPSSIKNVIKDFIK